MSVHAQSLNHYGTFNSGLIQDQVFSMKVDSKGNKWFGTLNCQVSKFDGTNWTSFTLPDSIQIHNMVTAIEEDKEGNIWFGTYLGYVYKYNHVSFMRMLTLGKRVQCISKDRQDQLWFGTSNYGVYKYDGVNVVQYNTLNSKLTNNSVLDILQDKTGKYWFATAFGISMFDGDTTWEQFSKTDGSLGYMGTVVCLAVDRDNQLWCGAMGIGLYALQGNTWKEYTPKNSGLVGSEVRGLTFDENNALWVATTSGITKYNGTDWKSFNQSFNRFDNQNYSYCYSIVSDNKNHNLWVGTIDGVFSIPTDTEKSGCNGNIMQEAIINGNFEEGSVGFSMGENASSYNLLAMGSNSTPGAYQVANNYSAIDGRSTFNSPEFDGIFDHSQPKVKGKMLMIDQPVNDEISWKTKIKVLAHHRYYFSAAIRELDAMGNNAHMQFELLLSNGTIVPLATYIDADSAWQVVNNHWDSNTQTEVELRVRNFKLGVLNGNDYALDDISFRTVCSEQQFSIQGNIYAGANPLSKGNAYLYNLDIQKSPIKIALVNNGKYEFTKLPSASYLLHIVPDSNAAQHFFPTYFHSHLTATTANPLLVTGNLFKVDIKLLPKPESQKGSALITGNIKYLNDSLTKLHLFNQVVLLKDVNNTTIDWTYTDLEGKFSFGSLALGSYGLNIEKKGYTTTNAVKLELTFNEQVKETSLNLIEQSLTDINHSEKSESYSVYPNPLNDQLFIDFTDQSTVIELSIVNLCGVVVYSNKVSTDLGKIININTSALSNGVYFLQLTHHDGSLSRTQVIK